MFEQIKDILPYLKSIRKVESYLSIDTIIPKTWKLPKKFISKTHVVEHESENKDNRLISFISEIDSDFFDTQMSNIKGIITYNLELEEKNRLLLVKKAELESIFDKNALSDLQGLSFKIKTSKQISTDEQSGQSVELVTE